MLIFRDGLASDPTFSACQIGSRKAWRLWFQMAAVPNWSVKRKRGPKFNTEIKSPSMTLEACKTWLAFDLREQCRRRRSALGRLQPYRRVSNVRFQTLGGN